MPERYGADDVPPDDGCGTERNICIPLGYVIIIADRLMMSTESLHSVVIETTCALSCVSHTNAWRVVYVSMTQLGLPLPRVIIMAASRQNVNRSMKIC